MPKSFRHLVQALACLALLASASLQAQESRLDRILESGVLRVATTGDYKPFSYRTEEGGYAGLTWTWRSAWPRAWGPSW